MSLLPPRRIPLRDVAVVVAATLLGTGIEPSFPSPGLDPSWEAGLAMAEQRGMVFGREILFTYGPWGWLDHAVMVTRSQLGFQLIFALLASAALISVLYALLRARMGFRSAAALTLVPVTLLCYLLAPDERVLVTSLAVSLLLIEYRHRLPAPWVAGFALGCLTGLFLLVKISSGVLVIPVLGVALLVWWRDWRVPLAGLAGLVLSVPALWLLAGQPLSAIPLWLRGSMELAGGYSDSLSVYPWTWLNYLIYAAVSVFILVLLWRRIRTGDYYRTQAIALALIGLAAVYYGLKLGFVREEGSRLVPAFAVLTPVLFFAVPTGLTGARAATTALVAPVAALLFVPNLAELVLWPLQSPNSQLTALRLSTSDAAFTAEGDKQRWKNRAEYRLDPDFLQQVQKHQVQIDPWETTLAWTYGLDWRPVPVFQLYAAYTPYLDQVNTDALSGPTAPTAVLVAAVGQYGIEGTNSAWVSPRYQLALGCGYRATSKERRAWTLLERESTSACQPGIQLGTVHAEARQSVPVPTPPAGSVVTVTFDSDDATLMKLQGALLKPSKPLRLKVDGTSFRVPYSLARTPLLLGCPGGGVRLAQGRCPDTSTISSDTAGTFTFSTVVTPPRDPVTTAPEGLATPDRG